MPKTLFALLTVLLSAGSIWADAAMAEPVVPTDPNQQFCLGAAPKGGRFKVQDISWPAAAGEAEVCLWKDDKYAALSITIDDNTKPDHEWWLEQCSRYGFPVTWFLITGGLDGGKNPGYNGKWPDYKALREKGMGIGSHTVSHHKDDNKRPDDEVRVEYGQSKASVEKNVGPCLTMGYPWGNGKADLAAEYYIASRGTVGYPNAAGSINYGFTNGGHLTKDMINAILGLPVEKPAWLVKMNVKRGWYTPLYHLVYYGHSKEEREASRKKVEDDIAYVGSHMDRLWVDTFENVAKYGQERDTATLKTTSSDGEKIVLSLTDRMMDAVFGFPLTVKVRLPDNWQTVAATQDGKPVEAKLVQHDGKPYALIQAVPDRGAITVTPAPQS